MSSIFEEPGEVDDWPVVPEERWGEIEKAKQGRYVVLKFGDLAEFKTKLDNGYFRALEALEYPVKIELEAGSQIVYCQGITWQEMNAVWRKRIQR